VDSGEGLGEGWLAHLGCLNLRRTCPLIHWSFLFMAGKCSPIHHLVYCFVKISGYSDCVLYSISERSHTK
jgi:hypothetical protein